jgi:alpha-N-acetylglucosaminidase
VWGTGFTSEGIDQNPVYYEFVLESNFRTERVANITDYAVRRAHRRYGLLAEVPEVTLAWGLLAATVYSQDLGYRDLTAVSHLGSADADADAADVDVWSWDATRHAPTDSLCKVYSAWGGMISAGAKVVKITTPGTPGAAVEAPTGIDTAEPFRYDLVDIGREVLAQLAGPAARNFTRAIDRTPALDAGEVEATGRLYAQVLLDLDTLVGTDSAFMLGPWLASARQIGGNATDCNGTVIGDLDCGDFMEWNARW